MVVAEGVIAGMKNRLPFALLLALCIAVTPVTAFAEGPSTWSAPIRLSGSGYATQPLIAADPYGGVHVVWTEGRGEKDAAPDTIYYSHLTGGNWTTPVDIIAATSPDTATPVTLAIDEQGYLVLLWRMSSSLLISRALVIEAEKAPSWNASVVAERVGVGGGSLQIAPDGSYHVAFARTNQELVYTSSSDHGSAWAPESLIASIEDAGSAIGEPYLAVDQADGRFAVWSRHTEATNWGPAGVWFARSTDGGASWLSAEEISPTGGHGWPNLFLDSQERLRLTWIGNLASGGRYEAISEDKGATFGAPTVITTPDQTRGYAARPQMVEDTGQTVHLLFGGLGGGAPDSIWYTRISARTPGGAWPLPINLSPNSSDSQVPAAAIGLGHLLHVVWEDYSEYNVYYSASDTGSPALAILPLPTRSTQEVVLTRVPADALPSPEATATRPAALDSTLRDSSSKGASSQSTMLILSLAPALLLVGAVVIISITRRKRQ